MLCAYYISGFKGIIVMFYHLIPNHSRVLYNVLNQSKSSYDSVETEKKMRVSQEHIEKNTGRQR